MFWLAFRLALHNRVRLVLTLLGVVFSSYLTLTEVALYVGMMENATSLIRHADADIWIASKGIRNFDFAKLFPASRVKAIGDDADMLWSRNIMQTWGFLKLPDGSQEQVEIIGYDPKYPVGGPWEMATGSAASVGSGANIILDESSSQRLGRLKLGSTWELNDQKVHLIGLSRSVKTFNTAPIVFTSFSYAQRVSSDVARDDGTAFTAIKLRRRSDSDRVIARLRQNLPDNAVISSHDFVRRTIIYWTAETGMGAAFCLTAFLGLIVGGGVIGQTVFANTMEHLGELATLKAMGATNANLDTLIISQAVIDASVGYAIGVALVFLTQPTLERYGVSLSLRWELLVSLLIFFLTIGVAAAFFSIRRVRRVDPAIVFRS